MLINRKNIILVIRQFNISLEEAEKALRYIQGQSLNTDIVLIANIVGNII